MALLLGACPQGVLAGEGPPAPRLEVFSGIDATSNSVFGYAGAAWAFGRDVTQPGFRLKALAGTGAYSYDSSLAGAPGTVDFDGDVTLARLLAGYLWRRGEWTVKAYGGVGFEDHDLSPGDPANSVSGDDSGLMGQIELWRNLGHSGFVSLDASYADAFDAYWTQAQLGRRIGRRFSAGIEGGALGNAEYDSGRGGAFLRYHRGGRELTLSGGVSGDYYSGDLGVYAAFGVYGRF